MSSDDAYASFLDQANQDTGAGEAESRGGGGGKQLKTADTEVPAPLKELDTYYTSETDEKFEGVALKWEGKGNIDEGEWFPFWRDVVKARAGRNDCISH